MQANQAPQRSARLPLLWIRSRWASRSLSFCLGGVIDRALNTMKTLIVIALCSLLISGCCAPRSPGVSAPALAQTYAAPEVGFSPKAVKVIDSLTGNPVSGATVQPLHLPRTNTYSRKTYLTDTNGIARPIVDIADYSSFAIAKEGYRSARYGFFDHESTNRIVRLKQLEPPK